MITIVNKFTVTGAEADFHHALDNIGAYMRAQPGHREYQLLRSVRRPEVYVETAVWADAESHRKAVDSDGFRAVIKGLAGIATPDADVYTVVVKGATS